MSPTWLLLFGAGGVGRCRGPCAEPALCVLLAVRGLLVLSQSHTIMPIDLSHHLVLFTGATHVQQAHQNLVAALRWEWVLLF